jgi:hypothetical protein
MRIVKYKGKAVKKQRALGDGNILVYPYDEKPFAVTVRDWRLFSTNEFHTNSDTRRRDVVRSSYEGKEDGKPTVRSGWFSR